MKKKYPLWTKIKFTFYYFSNYKGTGTITTCGKCGSTRVTFKEGKQEKNIYTSEYKCEDCGSTAKCIETWNIK